MYKLLVLHLYKVDENKLFRWSSFCRHAFKYKQTHSSLKDQFYADSSERTACSGSESKLGCVLCFHTTLNSKIEHKLKLI